MNEMVVTCVLNEQQDGATVTYTKVYRFEFDTDEDLEGALAAIARRSMAHELLVAKQ